MKNYIYLIVVICFSSSLIFSQQQQLSFESISPEKGFSAPLIRGVLQDSEGFLWFGALNGLYRYDGFILKPYVHDPNKKATISKGYVNVIYEDSRNNFWVGTSSGLNKLIRSTGDFEQFVPDSIGHILKNYIWSVFEDSKGVLWAGAMGLYTMDEKTGKLKPLVFPQGMEKLNSISFQSIAEDKNGFLWFGTTIGLIKYDRNTNNFIPVLIDPDADKLTEKNWNTGNYSMPTFYNDKSGFIWIGTYGGKMLKLNPETGEIIHFPVIDSKTFKPCAIQSIAEENENQFWLGTYSGLILFEKTSGKILSHYRFDENTEGGLTDDQIISVLKDKSGTLWAATLMGGLNRVNRTTFLFTTITKKVWMRDKMFSLVPYQDFFVSRSGSIFVGTIEGIEEIKPDLHTTIRHDPFKAINILMEDSQENHWVGLKQIAGGGIFKKDQAGKLYPIVDSLGKTFIKEAHCFFESSEGRIFFGTEFYLFEIDPERKTCSLIFQTRARIYALGEDNNGNLIIGTLLGGMHIFDPHQKKAIRNFMTVENDRTSIIDNSITAVYKDKMNRIWILTSLGICQYNPVPGTFKRYSQNQGQELITPLCMIEDKSGKLWLGTANGISMFDPETEFLRNYDNSYGTAEGYHYAVGQANGKIFFKAKPGITHFSPEQVKDNSFIPPVKITEFKVFDKSYPFNDNVDLAYDENYISFDFAALSFISPEKNQYAYKMEGIDKGWVYPEGRRYAAYTNLKPGEYVFKVKASNNDGVWNEEGTSLSITILPPWWQTYWAYAAYLLVVILLVYGWRKYDLKRQNLKFQLQTEHEYAGKLEEISQMKSRFFTNISHEFRTPLTLIIGPAEKIISGEPEIDAPKQAGMIKKNALRLLKLINQLLDISKLDEGKLQLKVSNGNIVSFVKGVVMIFESFAESKDIVLLVKPEREEINGYFDKEKLEKILINILSNAFKFTPGGGKIRVSVSELNEAAIIKIKDTGIGIAETEQKKLFDRFYQVDSSHTREHEGTGVGLALTKELVEHHRGKISVESKLGEWTEFTIELPLDRKFYDENQILETDTHIDSVGTDYINLKEQIKADLSDSLVPLTSLDHPIEKLVLLVVEDNSDVRQYIKDSLGKEFIIEEAANGEQGVRKAEMIIPDLIIGDIMMPKMDGYQMTKILKNDVKTNHIPIILLTAKSDQESKFEGLESGADDYLIKPFNTKELQIRINNLITIRKTLQEKYSGITKIHPEGEKKLSDVNEKFINRVIPIVHQHLKEEEFSIEEFSKELGMSRKQLYKKLKALTGKSPSRYVRSLRLSVAKEMIKEHKGNISEIAYSVGFSSPIYFSKCFKDEFGYPPSELLVS